MFLDTLAVKTGKKTQILQEFLKLLTGADVLSVAGLHPEHATGYRRHRHVSWLAARQPHGLAAALAKALRDPEQS